ncbi:MAG TPA: [FeFe] hydrogenase H-cluster maturation GTPase HydF [Bacillota bacterium]|nr:[FeFe] hydrogenase H-cluster maturation GTPase HydF [Bacillota bacterium]
MALNKTPSAERIHIGFFGKRNSGKSSIVNAVTGQDLAVVSDVKGTTTDPIYKSMELHPLGPIMIVDTPGIDDEGDLGQLRVKKSQQVLNKTDIAVVVIDSVSGKTKEDEDLISLLLEKKIKYILVYNKADLLEEKSPTTDNLIYTSTKTGYNIDRLKEEIAGLAVREEPKQKLVGDLISPSDIVVLVTPIDEAAPKGRLILPQQQTIRDILEGNATAIVVEETNLRQTLANLRIKPKLVITDSQVFAKVAADTPADVFLTSFSILFARYKGNLEIAVKGAKALETLEDGDTILISEGCTHHRQCEDIGTVKLPRWIKDYSIKQLNFEFTSGRDFPLDLSGYKLIVHCGGCMLNDREMKYRLKCAEDQDVPITNYGILISYIQGILERSIAIYPHIQAEYQPLP